MKDGERAAFGPLLRHFRLEAGLSQEALAERAWMSAETIGALERGARRSPYRETVALLADALGLNADDRIRLKDAGARPKRPRPRPPEPLHNLPSELSSLVGREKVAAEVGALIGAHRLVTLVGSGGVGKTRVALRVAENLLGALPDGVWLVELAPLGQPALVAGAIAQMLGVEESPHRPLIESIIVSLKRKHVMLVVDNCEHVIGEAAGIAAAILRGCPNVRILATSREPLHVSGEWRYRVPSLGYPHEGRVTAGQATEYAAVRLLVERARAADVAFALNDENAPAIAEVCRRLDGNPLAIELAAARVRTLGTRRIALMLDERFRILSGGDRTAPARLQAMRAAIDWSFALLGDTELALARRLAIFAGGWTLEAAEAVCSGEPIEAEQIPEFLASLVDKSLVAVAFSDGAARYGFQESIRAYALEQLGAAGERETIARRHAEWVADFAESALKVHFGLDRGPFMARFRAELDNGQAALEWARDLQQGDLVLAGRIASSAMWRGRGANEHDVVESVLARLQRSAAYPEIEAGLWCMLSSMTRGERKLTTSQKAVALFERASRSGWGLFCSLHNLSKACIVTGRYAEALAANDKELMLLRDLQMIRSSPYAAALRLRAQILGEVARYDEARALIGEAISLWDALGERDEKTYSLGSLAEIEFHAGNVRRALDLADEIAPRYDAAGNPGGGAWVRSNAAAYRLLVGETDNARITALEGLELARGISQLGASATRLLQHVATVAALRGDESRAARLNGYVEAWYAVHGEVREATDQRALEMLVAALRRRLSGAAIEALAAEGALLDEDDAVDIALDIARKAVDN